MSVVSCAQTSYARLHNIQEQGCTVVTCCGGVGNDGRPRLLPADADADAEAEAIAAAADSVNDAVEPEAAQLYLYYWGGIVTVSGGGI